MIDPRVLQQHFQKVQQREIPATPAVPRITNTIPLTTIQAIPTETIIEELPIIEELLPIETVTETQTVNKEPEVIEPLVIEEILPSKEQLPEIIKNNDNYDPYGYYSGPKF